MAIRTVSPTPVPEKTSWRYTGVLKDQAGVVVPAAALSTLTLKIHVLDGSDTDILASTNILNLDRGAVDANGNLAIMFLPSDSAMVDITKTEEQHVATIEYSWNGGTRQAAHEVAWLVRNLAKRS